MHNPPEWLKLAWSVVAQAVVRLWTLIVKHPGHLLVAAVVVLCANQLVSWWRHSTGRQFVMYVGAPGTTGNRLGNRIAAEIRRTSPAPGVDYRVAVVPTHGVVDIEEQVGSDLEGRAIGMTVDGKHHTDGLRTLLPLDWDYLHILASVKFVRAVQQQRGGNWPEELSDVLPSLKYRSVFAGPSDSGTHRIASRVFERYHRDVNDLIDPALSDWEQAAAALKAGAIDLAFYCGPIEATTVSEIAKEGSAVLLGVRDITSALIQDDRYSLIKLEFPLHAYRADAIPLLEKTAPLSISREPATKGLSPLVRDPLTASEPTTPPSPTNATVTSPEAKPPSKELFFCGRPVTTVAARRLIVVSKAMSNYDAYLISGAVKNLLVNERDIPADPWDRKPPATPSAVALSDFAIPVHPGAELLRKNMPYESWWNPASWSSTVRSIGLGMMTLLATSCLQVVLGWVKLTGASGSEPASAPRSLPEPAIPTPMLSEERKGQGEEAYERLLAAIEANLHELERCPESLPLAEHREWTERVLGLRSEIRTQLAEETISPAKAEVLFAALRNLRMELAGIGRAKSTTKTAASTAAEPTQD